MQRLVIIKDNKVIQDFTDTVDKEYALQEGATWQECELGWDKIWYLLGHAPEKPQAEIDQERIAELQTYLNSTDWYAVRYAETGVAIPEDVVTARASAREEISTLRGDVEGVI